jgi:hypothetical protein
MKIVKDSTWWPQLIREIPNRVVSLSQVVMSINCVEVPHPEGVGSDTVNR